MTVLITPFSKKEFLYWKTLRRNRMKANIYFKPQNVLFQAENLSLPDTFIPEHFSSQLSVIEIWLRGRSKAVENYILFNAWRMKSIRLLLDIPV